MGVLYKYMRKEHADLLVDKGCLRIGTLYEFRNEEKHGKAIGDNQEGKKCTYMVAETQEWTEHTQPEFTKGLFKIKSGATVHISGGGTIEKPEESPDCYVFCTTSQFDTSAMRDFGYDTCVVIEQPEKFLKELSKKLRHKGEYLATVPCRYQERRVLYQQETGHHPAVIKEPEYEYQKEVRSIWVPKKAAIQPIFVQSRDLTKYCHIKKCE